jgi:hypothetical protein
MSPITLEDIHASFHPHIKIIIAYHVLFTDSISRLAQMPSSGKYTETQNNPPSCINGLQPQAGVPAFHLAVSHKIGPTPERSAESHWTVLQGP